MEFQSLLEAWPLQRLLQMITFLQAKDNESWKRSSILSSSLPEKDIGPEERDAVVSWIAKLNDQFNFNPETFFLATSILDRFISSVKVQTKYLKCIAVSCLYLASKITEEEDMIPCTGELVKESSCGCRVCDVLRMERIILEKLSWHIHSSTVLDYLHVFQTLAFGHFTDQDSNLLLTRRMKVTARLLKRLVCKYTIASFPNVVIALAVVSIELETLTCYPAKWISVTGRLQVISRVTTDELMTCRECLLSFLPSRLVKQQQDKPVHFKKFTSFTRKCTQTGMQTLGHYVGTNSSGVSKRKATSPSPSKLIELSKKPHPENDVTNGTMEVETGLQVSSDISSIESINKFNQNLSTLSSISRRLTYAEIVKCGLECCEDKSTCLPSDISRGCSYEANQNILSVLSPNSSNQARIKT